MPSKTRGAIEEGTVTFTHESSKAITFKASSVQNASFPSPPVVKLISASTALVDPPAVQTNLLFNASTGVTTINALHENPSNSDVSSHFSDSDAFNTPLTVSPDNTYIGTYSGLGDAVKISRGQGGGFRVGFDNSAVTEASKIVFYFSLKFDDGWDNSSSDSVVINYVNSVGHDQTADKSPNSPSQTQQLDSQIFVNKEGSWVSVKSLSDTRRIFFNGTELTNALGNEDWHSNEQYYWFKIEATAGSETLADVVALYFDNSASAVSNEALYVANLQLIVFPTTSVDFSLFGQHLQQANIGVTFTSVTTTGMTVITTAPFTGDIRYLCTVQG